MTNVRKIMLDSFESLRDLPNTFMSFLCFVPDLKATLSISFLSFLFFFSFYFHYPSLLLLFFNLPERTIKLSRNTLHNGNINFT